MLGALEKGLSFLQFKMQTPTMYGWFHLLSLSLMVALILILIWKKPPVKRMLLIFSLIMIVLEIYKQLSFSYSGGEWSYQWYAFPFQFCSVPMYVALIAGLTKHPRVEQYICCFLATYGLVAGLAVMAYPVTVFIPEVLISVQTMVHHGFMVVMGVCLLVRRAVAFTLRTLLRGLAVFASLVAIALAANVVTYHADVDDGLELFYISPYHTSELPVFDQIYEAAPYPIFLLCYLFAFTVGGGIPLLVGRLLRKRA